MAANLYIQAFNLLVPYPVVSVPSIIPDTKKLKLLDSLDDSSRASTITSVSS